MKNYKIDRKELYKILFIHMKVPVYPKMNKQCNKYALQEGYSVDH